MHYYLTIPHILLPPEQLFSIQSMNVLLVTSNPAGIYLLKLLLFVSTKTCTILSGILNSCVTSPRHGFQGSFWDKIKVKDSTFSPWWSIWCQPHSFGKLALNGQYGAIHLYSANFLWPMFSRSKKKNITVTKQNKWLRNSKLKKGSIVLWQNYLKCFLTELNICVNAFTTGENFHGFAAVIIKT